MRRLAQEFKDTRPTNEPNTTVDYQDPTDVDEVQDEIKNGVIDPISQTFALWDKLHYLFICKTAPVIHHFNVIKCKHFIPLLLLIFR